MYARSGMVQKVFVCLFVVYRLLFVVVVVVVIVVFLFLLVLFLLLVDLLLVVGLTCADI